MQFKLTSIVGFRDLIKAVSAVAVEATILSDEAGISLKTMDPSHVALVEFALPAEYFDAYTPGEKITIHFPEFLKFLDHIDKDEETWIHLDEEKARLVILCKRGGHSRRFEMPILGPIDDEVPQPKMLFKAKARILTSGLRVAIKDAVLVSEHVKVSAEGGGLKVSAVGDMGSAHSEWEKGSDDLIDIKAEEDSSATFTLSLLDEIVSAAGNSGEVATIELSTDTPIKMDFELPKGKLVYYLAPCIGV
jgi:proliferating cell nuclear antigen